MNSYTMEKKKKANAEFVDNYLVTADVHLLLQKSTL